VGATEAFEGREEDRLYSLMGDAASRKASKRLQGNSRSISIDKKSDFSTYDKSNSLLKSHLDKKEEYENEKNNIYTSENELIGALINTSNDLNYSEAYRR
jgi:hypothetical protein